MISDLNRFIKDIEKSCEAEFLKIENIAYVNQKKVLNAFKQNKVSARHFAATNGYGYDDIGRDTLSKVFANIFNTESAIVSPSIASGTHALSLCLFGLLKAGDTMLSISGKPYDTLDSIITGDDAGSFKSLGINYCQINLKDNDFDLKAIGEKIKSLGDKLKLVFLQRSRGYEWRNALTIEQIKSAVQTVKKNGFTGAILTDNCYGEFVDVLEPSDVGVSVVAGSLIKNPGGGLAPTGGYIAGLNQYIDKIAARLTVPGIGCEIGSYAAGYQSFYQGVFIAPHVVAQSLKSAVLFCTAYKKLGYKTLPEKGTPLSDIICSIEFNTKDELINFCKTIQSMSPIDSYVTPEPWPMPGYNCNVIMAAGCFVQGASIELSCDSPIRMPYIAYLQGALTYEHAKCALYETLSKL